MQIYSDPSRASDPYALPDVEVFYNSQEQALSGHNPHDHLACLETGWYWWPCFPGCLPDGDPTGPFKTEEEAIADAQNYD